MRSPCFSAGIPVLVVPCDGVGQLRTNLHAYARIDRGGQNHVLCSSDKAAARDSIGHWAGRATRFGTDGAPPTLRFRLLLLPPRHRRDPHPQRVELDEAAGVGLVVGAAVFVEGGDVLVE
jgi:hypothetical protein